MLRSLTLCHQLLEHGQVPRHYQNKSPKELKEIPFLVHPLKFMYPTSFAFKVDSFFYQTQFYHAPGGSCCSQDEKQILRMIYMTSRDLSGPACCFTLISDTYFLQISPVPTPQSRDISPLMNSESSTPLQAALIVDYTIIPHVIRISVPRETSNSMSVLTVFTSNIALPPTTKLNTFMRSINISWVN